MCWFNAWYVCVSLLNGKKRRTFFLSQAMILLLRCLQVVYTPKISIFSRKVGVNILFETVSCFKATSTAHTHTERYKRIKCVIFSNINIEFDYQRVFCLVAYFELTFEISYPHTLNHWWNGAKVQTKLITSLNLRKLLLLLTALSLLINTKVFITQKQRVKKLHWTLGNSYKMGKC